MKTIFFTLLLLAPVLAGAQTTSFTMSASTVCQDSCITFTNTSTGAADSIRWSVTGNTVSDPDSNVVTVCFSDAGYDTAKLYVYRHGVADSVSHTVTINNTPHPMIIGINSFGVDSFTCCTVANIYASYQWYSFGGGYALAGEDSNVCATCNDVAGTYYVLVDSGGCPGMSNLVYAPVNAVPVVNAAAHVITISPNPAQGIITITASVPLRTLSVYNVMGQEVYIIGNNARGASINVSSFPAGIYYVKVNGTAAGKFIKE